MLRSLWLRLSRRARLEQDLRDEIEFHLAMKADQLGDPNAARRAFGNDTRVCEDLRDAWSFRFLESLWQDVRHAARSIAKSPAFALTAVLSLAIGIGANTAIFTVLHGIYLKSLPVREPAQLRMLAWTGDKTPAQSISGYGFMAGGVKARSPFSWDAYQAIAARHDAFESIAAFAQFESNVVAGGQAQVLNAYLVSGGYFDTLGTSAAIGRTLTEADNLSDAPNAAVVSWGFAQRFFGDPGRAVGSSITIDRVPYTVAGVLQPAYSGLLRSYPTDIYVPLSKRAEVSPVFRRTGPQYWWVQLIGRLNPEATDAQATAQLDLVLAQVTQAASAALGRTFQPPKALLRDGARGLAFLGQSNYEFLLALFAMVGVVLLIACTNVANLLLARGTARAREFAVRRSLGAGRGRIARHLLTETALITAAGTLLGLVLAQVGTALLTPIVVFDSETSVRLQPDAQVLGFTLVLAVTTAVLAGLVPAWRASTSSPVATLRQQGSGGGRQRLARTLVAAQIALAVILVSGAGLFARTMVNLSRVPLGFRSDNLLLFYVDASRNGHKGDDLVRTYERIQEHVASIPGVRAVTHSRSALLSGSMSTSTMKFPAAGEKEVWRHSVGDDFLTVMGTPIRAGRDLGRQDGPSAPFAAVVNEALARKYFDGAALGQRFQRDGNTYRIVGIAADSKYNELNAEAPPTAYFSWRQEAKGLSGVHFAIRTDVDPHNIIPAVRKAVASVDSTLPVANIRTQREQIDRGIARERTFAALALFFSAVAVLLACIGIYGVLAYAVSRRTGEFGIRLALGATPAGISWLVVRSMLPPVAAAVALGIPAALAASKLVKAMLYGVEPDDAATLMAAVAIISICAAAAALLPTRRAARCDPAVALRYE